MALRFSAVKLTAQEKSCELLVGGVPTGYEDLTGWTAFDNFLKDIDDDDKVNVQVDMGLPKQSKKLFTSFICSSNTTEITLPRLW